MYYPGEGMALSILAQVSFITSGAGPALRTVHLPMFYSRSHMRTQHMVCKGDRVSRDQTQFSRRTCESTGGVCNIRAHPSPALITLSLRPYTSLCMEQQALYRSPICLHGVSCPLPLRASKNPSLSHECVVRSQAPRFTRDFPCYQFFARAAFR